MTPRTRRRLLLSIPFLLVSPLLLYWLAAYLFFSTEWGYRWIHSPESRTQITWTSGRSWIPGVLEVEGLTLDGTSRQVDWHVVMDKARGRLDLRTLAQRRVRIAELSVSGFEAAVQRRDEILPRRPPKPDAWWIEVDNIVAAGARSFTYDEWRLEGEGSLRGAFGTRSRGGPYYQLPTRIDFRDALLTRSGETWVRDTTAVLEVEIAEHLPREGDTLAYTTASLRADGTVAVPPEMTQRLKDQGVNLERSEGQLRLELPIKKGIPTAGALVDLEIPEVDVELGDGYRAEGRLAARMELTDDSGATALDARVEGRQLEILGTIDGDALRASAARASVSDQIELPEDTDLRSLADVVRATLQRSGLTNDDATSPGPAASGPSASATNGPLRQETLENIDLRLEALELDLPLKSGDLALTADSARVTLEVAPVEDRQLVLPAFSGSGIEMRYETRARNRPRQDSASWSISAPALDLRELRSLRFGRYEARRLQRARARIEVEAGGRYRVNDARFEMKDGVLLIANQPVIEGLALKADLDYGPTAAGGSEGAELLRPLSGSAHLDAKISSLAPLALLLRSSSAVDLAGRGDLTVDLFLEKGRLLAASRAIASSKELEMSVLDNLVRGDARLLAEVGDTSRGPRADLNITFDDFTYGPTDRPDKPLVVGRGFTVNVDSRRLDLASNPFRDARVDVRLPKSTIPDMSALTDTLPASAGLTFGKRPGTLESRLTFSSATDTAEGEVRLAAEDFLLRWGGVTLQGPLDLVARLNSEDLKARRFQLSRTEALLQPMRVTDDSNESVDSAWWLQLTIPQGTVHWKRPVEVEGTLDLKMKNTALLAAIFLDRSRRNTTWLARALTSGPVVAQAEVQLGSSEFIMDPLDAQLNDFQVRSRLRFQDSDLIGQFLLEYRNLAIGVGIDGEDRSFHARGSRDWFNAREGWPDR